MRFWMLFNGGFDMLYVFPTLVAKCSSGYKVSLTQSSSSRLVVLVSIYSGKPRTSYEDYSVYQRCSQFVIG